MNENFVKDISKAVRNTDINQELSPGSVGRRYEPALGVNKHNKRIHAESKIADNMNMPFTFRKPPKSKGRAVYLKCNNCGHVTSGSSATVGVICNNCKKFSGVTEVES